MKDQDFEDVNSDTSSVGTSIDDDAVNQNQLKEEALS
jgi:hypothetical protein